GDDGHPGHSSIETDPALLQEPDHTIGRSQAERAPTGQENGVDLGDQHAGAEQVGLAGGGGPAADLARAHSALRAQHDGAAGHAIRVREVADPDPRDVGDHVVRAPAATRPSNTSPRNRSSALLNCECRSMGAMWPAPSSTTSWAWGRAAARRRADAGGVRRSRSPTMTSEGTATCSMAWRRSMSSSAASPSVHASTGAWPETAATCSISAGEALGPKFDSRATRKARSDSPIFMYRLTRSARAGALASARRRDRMPPTAPRSSSAAAVSANTVPTTRFPNSSGWASANARMAMPPMLWPTSTAGPSGTVASSTAFRSPPIACRGWSPPSAAPLRPCPLWSYTMHRYRRERTFHW